MNEKTYTPYTYLIGWTKFNKWYYGRRTFRNCNPSEFWVTYFTSSKHVAKFTKQHGNPDVIQIRKIFKDSKKCCIWESKVLKRLNVQHSSKWLNQKNGDQNWDTTGCSYKKTEKSKQKQAKTVLEKYGVKNVSKSELIKEKRKQTFLKRYGVKHNFFTDEFKNQSKNTWLEKYGVDNPNKRIIECKYCKKITKPAHEFQCNSNPNRINNGHTGASNGRAKEYLILDPNEKLYTVVGELKKFCQNNSISPRLLTQNGTTKGWKLISSKKGL